MSLLMEALKKAERAKQEHTIPHEADSALAAGRSPLGQSGDAPEKQDRPGTLDEELALLPAEQAAASHDAGDKSEFPPITAARDIPAALDLTLEPVQGATLAHTRPAPVAPEPAPAFAKQEPVSAGSRPDAIPNPAADSPHRPIPHTDGTHKTPVRDDRKVAAAQQKAKSVFAAKQPARSRTLLLAGAAAAIVAGVAAFGVYYWQIVSGSTAALPPGMAQQTAMPAPPPAVPAGDSPPPQPAGAAPTQVSLNSASTPSQNAPVAAASDPEEKPSAAAQPSPPTPPADPLANPGQPSSGQAIRIRQTAATSQLNPTLGKAYQSFLAGDTDMAQQQYHKVLQQEANNRDALLGLAAVALNRKQAGQAAAYYTKLLDLNPADPDALAGLVGLQGQTDPVQSESRLKKILAQNPQAGALHFALGNLYAQQSRWAEAQQSYFRAYSNAPNNADYAFNLAVSLDTLNQGKLALDYYQRALALSQSGPANFDKAAARNRATELHTIVHGLQPAESRSPSGQQPAGS